MVLRNTEIGNPFPEDPWDDDVSGFETYCNFHFITANKNLFLRDEKRISAKRFQSLN